MPMMADVEVLIRFILWAGHLKRHQELLGGTMQLCWLQRIMQGNEVAVVRANYFDQVVNITATIKILVGFD
jgi:hypothetical protein